MQSDELDRLLALCFAMQLAYFYIRFCGEEIELDRVRQPGLRGPPQNRRVPDTSRLRPTDGRIV